MTISRAHIRNWLVRPLNLIHRPNDRPLLVFGNQKSGTTAIAKLTGLMTGRRVTSDVFCRLPGSCEARVARGEMSVAQLVRRNGYYFSAGIIKDPGFTFLASTFVDEFPHACRVFICRDPRENIRSILNRLQIPGHLDSLTASHLNGVNRHWRVVLDGDIHHHRGTNYIHTLALRWNAACDQYFRHRDKMMLVRYEDFVADKAGTIRQIAEEAGFAEKRDIRKYADVAFQRRGMRGVKWHEFFEEQNLSTIDATCREAMAQMGYESSRVAA